MRIRITYDPKKDQLDYFTYADPGPIPPLVVPHKPNEPKDGGVTLPEPKPEPKPN
jgi:hypothetical protein